MHEATNNSARISSDLLTCLIRLVASLQCLLGSFAHPHSANGTSYFLLIFSSQSRPNYPDLLEKSNQNHVGRKESGRISGLTISVRMDPVRLDTSG